MTDQLETTWGALAKDNTILDATGKQWRVFSVDPGTPPGPQVQVGITDGDRYVTVDKDKAEAVLTVPAAVADITDGAVATESAAEAQARQVSDTFPPPSEFSPLEFRTHLYLVHADHGATGVMTQDEMKQWHAELHSRDDMPTPHEHTS